MPVGLFPTLLICHIYNFSALLHLLVRSYVGTVPVNWTICSYNNSIVCLYIKLLHFEELLGHLGGGTFGQDNIQILSYI